MLYLSLHQYGKHLPHRFPSCQFRPHLLPLRRYKELEEKGVSCDLEEIKKDIKERDERDCTRKIAPLRQAEDAVLIDSSDMTIEEVVKAITDNIV